MKHRGVAHLAVWALAVILSAQSAAAELSARQLRKVGKKADEAYAAGRTDEALGYYREILDSTKDGDPSRQNALYAVFMSQLAADAGKRDGGEMQKVLGEIEESFPRHPRKLELLAARSWLSEVEAVRLEAEKSAAELLALRAEFAETREAVAGEAAGEVKSCQEKLSSTQRTLRGVRSELAKKVEELEKKEEALQKLKNAIVGGGGR